MASYQQLQLRAFKLFCDGLPPDRFGHFGHDDRSVGPVGVAGPPGVPGPIETRCVVCKGRGVEPDAGYIICRNCEGDGVVRCSTCKGEGFTPL